MSCLQNFTIKEILNSHRKRCFLINGTQAVIFETGITKFKNYEKQIPITFKIIADSDCSLKKLILIKVDIQNYIKNIYPILRVLNQFVLIIDLLYQLKFLLVVIVLKNLLNGFLNKKSIVIK